MKGIFEALLRRCSRGGSGLGRSVGIRAKHPRKGVVLAQAAQQLAADHGALLAAAAQHIAVLLRPPAQTALHMRSSPVQAKLHGPNRRGLP